MESSLNGSVCGSDNSQILADSVDATRQNSTQFTSVILHKEYQGNPKQSSDQTSFGFTSNKPIFHSPRTRLKLLNSNDENIYTEIFTDESITIHTGGHVKLDSAKASFSRSLSAVEKTPVKYITWCVEEKSSNIKLGIATLTLISEVARCGEIGLMFKESCHCKGLGTEIVELLITIGFEYYKLKSLISYTEVANTRAQHVLKKFKFEQYQSEHLIPHTASGIFWRLLLCANKAQA